MKFGGTSLADAQRIDQAARRVHEAKAAQGVLVVASALAGVTDLLSRAADRAERGQSAGLLNDELEARHLEVLDGLTADPQRRRRGVAALRPVLAELARNLGSAMQPPPSQPPGPLRARILAAGERLSVPLLALAIGLKGYAAQAVDAARIVSTHAGDPLDAAVDLDATRRRTRAHVDRVAPGTVHVVTGFVAGSAQGETVLLGRGGSDTTATVLGAALDAERVEIWTDVDGVLTADPKRDPKAELIPHLSFAEAEKRARNGAKVLHPRAVAPAAAAGIPIVVRNSFRPEHPGTWIGPERLRRAG